MRLPTAHVDRARGGQITDQTLDTLAGIAAQIERGEEIDDAAGQLMLLTLRPVVEELRQRRAAADVIKDLVTPGNVLMFRGAADAPAA